MELPTIEEVLKAFGVEGAVVTVERGEETPTMSGEEVGGQDATGVFGDATPIPQAEPSAVTYENAVNNALAAQRAQAAMVAREKHLALAGKRGAQAVLASEGVQRTALTSPPKVLIGVPCNWENEPIEFTNCLLRFTAPMGVSAKVYPCIDWTIDRMRNRIAEKAVLEGYTHVLMLDADMTYPPDILTRLLSDNADIVQGLAVRRMPVWVTQPTGERKPKHPAIFMKHTAGHSSKFQMDYRTPPETGTHEVDAVGMGGTLIRTDVFAALQRPWFTFDGGDGEDVGEDVRFSVRAREAGFKCFCNTDVVIGHLIRMAMIWEKGGVSFKYTTQDA